MLYVLIICVWTELFHTKRLLWEYISLTSSSPLACASLSVSVDFRKRRGSKLTGFLTPKISFAFPPILIIPTNWVAVTNKFTIMNEITQIAKEIR